jgi:hypothetical protein
MEEILFVDEEQIGNFFYNELISRGYAPGEAEIEDLSEIAFDLLVELGIVQEESIEYYEEDEE